jgi:hypothetical protein
MGATVTGPALQPIRDVVARGPFGSIAARRDAAGLADALEREVEAWDAGRRDPAAIAAYWRARLDITVVAERYAELLDQGAPSIAKRP